MVGLLCPFKRRRASSSYEAESKAMELVSDTFPIIFRPKEGRWERKRIESERWKEKRHCGNEQVPFENWFFYHCELARPSLLATFSPIEFSKKSLVSLLLQLLFRLVWFFRSSFDFSLLLPFHLVQVEERYHNIRRTSKSPHSPFFVS